MTKIILTRHGHVEGIEPKRFRGRTEIPLTEQGRKEARAVATRIAATWRPTLVYTSPMRRCIDTGQAIADACGTQNVPIPELQDLDYGDWQWRTYDEIEAEAPELFAAWFVTPQLIRFPGGDSLQDLVARSADAIRLVLERHPTDTVVLVGHDSVNRGILLQLLDQPLSAYWRLAQEPCAINEIDIDDDRIRVERVNDTSHL
ncbi:MAG TPA: histidine phosphatase family protein [Rhizomicrobium sp.]|jgi:probable phosphoglycerate mutase|nr:histidine phosphatase family protein [Rhizomicrobium sp.]